MKHSKSLREVFQRTQGVQIRFDFNLYMHMWQLWLKCPSWRLQLRQETNQKSLFRTHGTGFLLQLRFKFKVLTLPNL